MRDESTHLLPSRESNPKLGNVMPWLFFRFEVGLTAKQSIRLPPFLGSVIYATIAEAWHRATGAAPQLPDDLWIEVGRSKKVSIEPGEQIMFALTTIQRSAVEMDDLLSQLQSGLVSVGANGISGSILGGNFELTSLTHLPSRSTYRSQLPMPNLSLQDLFGDIDFIELRDDFRIRFDTPLRLQRMKSDIVAGHRYLDNDYFPINRFVTSLTQRLIRLRVIGEFDPKNAFDQPFILKRKLRWQEFRYGHSNSRKTFGGVTGEVELNGVSRELGRILTVGQHFGVGELTRFGFGRYRIVPQL